MFVVVGVAAVADFTVAFVWVMELASGTNNSNLMRFMIQDIQVYTHERNINYQNLLQNIQGGPKKSL